MSSEDVGHKRIRNNECLFTKRPKAPPRFKIADTVDLEIKLLKLDIIDWKKYLKQAPDSQYTYAVIELANLNGKLKLLEKTRRIA